MNREGQTMKKTFKTLTALLATATLAFGLTACNDKEPAKDGAKTVSSLEQIQKDGKVRIGVFSDKPPFGYVDAQGKSQGFDVELIRRRKQSGICFSRCRKPCRILTF